MRSALSLACLALLCSALAPARAETTTNTKDGSWRGLAGASVSLSAGNTESTSVLTNVNLSRQTEEEKTSVQAFTNHSRAKIDGEQETTANKWGISGQQDVDITPVWFGFGRLGFDADRLLDLNLRSNVSAGLGYHVIDTDAHAFDVFGGLSYTNRRYSEPQELDGKTSRHFNSVGLILGMESSHQISDAVSAKQRLEYFPSYSGDRTQLLKFTASLNVSLSKELSLAVGVNSTHNSRVPDGVKKTDTIVFTGLNIKLGS